MDELVQVGGQIAAGTTDTQAVELWLATGRRRSDHTRRAYRSDALAFMAYVAKPLGQVTVGDLVRFRDDDAAGAGASSSGGVVAAATRLRRIASVKSMFSTLHNLGYLRFDVGSAVELPAVRDTLADRILQEEDVIRMITSEPDHRNALLLRLLYATGARISEICTGDRKGSDSGLRWRDCSVNGASGQVVLYGKRGKTRSVLVSTATWMQLQSFRPVCAADDDYVFLSTRSGRPLDTSQALRIVRAAAVRVGITQDVSPHWLRHANASHSLDRGASLSVVQATLGHSSLTTTTRYTHARPTDSSGLHLAI